MHMHQYFKYSKVEDGWFQLKILFSKSTLLSDLLYSLSSTQWILGAQTVPTIYAKWMEGPSCVYRRQILGSLATPNSRR